MPFISKDFLLGVPAGYLENFQRLKKFESGIEPEIVRSIVHGVGAL